jgi:hypothetical protein
MIRVETTLTKITLPTIDRLESLGNMEPIVHLGCLDSSRKKVAIGLFTGPYFLEESCNEEFLHHDCLGPVGQQRLGR